jgi:uncharacterized membrane protein YqhA
VRRIIELSRYVVVLPALGALVGSLVLMIIGLWEIVTAVYQLSRLDVELKASIVSILAAVDTLLLATVLLVIGYGLYELFVDEDVELPAWLQIHSLDDLKGKLIGVVVAVIAVVFLGELVQGKDPEGVMMFGIGAGALVLALAAFQYATRSSGKPSKGGSSDPSGTSGDK